MKYKVWERKFKRELNPLSKDEKARSLEYYREIYSDKISGGIKEEDITAEFGSPQDCAKKILDENGIQPKVKKGVSVAEIIGLVFMTLILVVPLVAVAISIIASFAAVCVSGIACAVGGIGIAFYYPFSGVTTSGAIGGIGMGIAISGAGLLLFVLFYYVTKYTAIGLWKVFKGIYVRR